MALVSKCTFGQVQQLSSRVDPVGEETGELVQVQAHGSQGVLKPPGILVLGPDGIGRQPLACGVLDRGIVADDGIPANSRENDVPCGLRVEGGDLVGFVGTFEGVLPGIPGPVSVQFTGEGEF